MNAVDTIVVLDFGSQTAQLIARRVRELSVYSELLPWNAPKESLPQNVKGFILSGGPESVYEPEAPVIPNFVLESGLPVLGICYGMQALTHALGGKVAASTRREYGRAEVKTLLPNALVEMGRQDVWMSHGDRIEAPPAGFVPLAATANSPVAAMGDPDRAYYGLQFHPEVQHTPGGREILRRFALDICGAGPDWTPASIIETSVERIRQQVGSASVLAGVSGGVDSTVATALVQRAVGSQLTAVFVKTGMLRQGEGEEVQATLGDMLGVRLVVVDAEDRFLKALEGVTDPEQKRRIIGETFIRVFEEEARKLAGAGAMNGRGTAQSRFLVQGTIYPDVVESQAADRSQGQRIKTHHNVGGLPEEMDFELVEPLRYLFKDEVRTIGAALGLPEEVVWRQPFPGPGLAVRCLGEVTHERLARLRAADAILTEELRHAGFLGKDGGVSQALAVLLPVRSVGVMGDRRTYQEAVVLRVVTTEDFMTADWARLPHDLLARISNRIVNEANDINRVVYDITSKPPATIEWE